MLPIAFLVSHVSGPLLAVEPPQAFPLSPVLILVLCVVGGVGTVLALPSARETSWRKIGAVLLGAAGLILAALLVRSAAGPAGTPRAGVGPYFWIFSAIALAGAMRVVTHPRPVYAALYFVMTVMASAGLFVLLSAEFMAAALVLIYAGAILVTYVFVIMLAAQAGSQLAEYDATSREPLATSTVGFLLMGVLLLVIFDRAQGLTRVEPPREPGLADRMGMFPQSEGAVAAANDRAPALVVASSPTQQLAQYLFAHQLVNLELAGIILTVAMVGAIVIARRRVTGAEAAFEPVAEAAGIEAPGGSDDPHAIPIVGTDDPRQKEYPEE
jgi:NADH-quinone oxidoreductase subunit J